MGWSIGYDEHWQRDVGYGVPSVCDFPGCARSIDRGLSYICGGEVYGGEHGCGLFFCNPKPDTAEWIMHKLTDPSWQVWRDENPEEVRKLKGEQ